MESKVYNQKGEAVGSIDLPQAIFSARWNADLVHQVVVGMQANRRRTIASTKARGEVRGGGRKPWKQKGTGRARHGSIRSPIWRGGGVTHGPLTERTYVQKINKQMKRAALRSILSQKFRDQEIVFLDSLTLSQPKTKAGAEVIKQLSTAIGLPKLKFRTGHRALIAVTETDSHVLRGFRNLPQVRVEETRNLNPELLLRYQYTLLIKPEASLATLTKLTD